MNLREFGIVEKKLGLQARDAKHHYAYFVHNGVTVARTMRSHGNNKFLPEHSIRKQLHLSSSEFRELIGCSLQLDDYVKILMEKRIIAAPQSSETAS